LGKSQLNEAQNGQERSKQFHISKNLSERYGKFYAAQFDGEANSEFDPCGNWGFDPFGNLMLRNSGI
jgi:hypothetical protein